MSSEHCKLTITERSALFYAFHLLSVHNASSKGQHEFDFCSLTRTERKVINSKGFTSFEFSAKYLPFGFEMEKFGFSLKWDICSTVLKSGAVLILHVYDFVTFLHFARHTIVFFNFDC